MHPRDPIVWPFFISLLCGPYSLEPPEDINQINISSLSSPSAYSSEMLQQLRQSTPSTPKAMVDAGMAQDDDALLLASKFPATMGAKLGGSGIPDANAIHAAKKKRELMRQGITIQDDDFIPLGDGVSSWPQHFYT